jgi:hypothetical protein
MSQMPVKWKYVVTLDVEHFCGKRRTVTTDGIQRRGIRAIRKFKKDLAAHLKRQGWSMDVVQFSDVPAIIIEAHAIVTVTCDHWVSNHVRNVAGVASMERAPVRRIPR